MKIAAIVVLYHPDQDAFLDNLGKYAKQVDSVLVWRNSPIEFDVPEEFSEKIIWCGTQTNAYIAEPLNYALDWCQEHQYDYLLTMDQDSSWEDFGSFLSTVEALPKENVAIFAPNINGPKNGGVVADVESVVTSCSLCNVQIAQRLGGFREDYRIYWVDSEYCLWARRNGYRIQVLCQHFVRHVFGASTIVAFGFKASNYSATTYYFLFRNMLWMRREFWNEPSLKCIAHTFAYYIPGIILGEKNKVRKLASIAKACFLGCFKGIPSKRRKKHKE